MGTDTALLLYHSLVMLVLVHLCMTVEQSGQQQSWHQPLISFSFGLVVCCCCCCLSFVHLGSLKPITIVDLQAAVTRLVSRQLAAAWATWQQALLHSKDKKAKAQRALSYLTNSTLRRAFDCWRSHQQLNLEKHDKLLKAVSYFTQGALHRAFDNWRAECGRAAEKQELMRKATNWLLQSGLTKVLGSP